MGNRGTKIVSNGGQGRNSRDEKLTWGVLGCRRKQWFLVTPENLVARVIVYSDEGLKAELEGREFYM